jgi:hypothetical protein
MSMNPSCFSNARALQQVLMTEEQGIAVRIDYEQGFVPQLHVTVSDCKT